MIFAGNDPASYSLYNPVGRTYMDLTHPMSGSGYVNQFKIYASNVYHPGFQVKFKVYRDDGTNYNLIYNSGLVTIYQTGVNVYNVSPFWVESGDLVSIYTPNASDVALNTGAGTSVYNVYGDVGSMPKSQWTSQVTGAWQIYVWDALCSSIGLTGQSYDSCPTKKYCGDRKFCTYSMGYRSPPGEHFHNINIYDLSDVYITQIGFVSTEIGITKYFAGGSLKLIAYSGSFPETYTYDIVIGCSTLTCNLAVV